MILVLLGGHGSTERQHQGLTKFIGSSGRKYPSVRLDVEAVKGHTMRENLEKMSC